MASVRNPDKSRPDKWRVDFRDKNGKAKSFWMEGSHTKKDARKFLDRVEDLLSAVIRNGKPDAETSEWLAGLGDTMIERLARVGLTEARVKRESLTLKDALDRFIGDLKGHRKPRTITNLEDMLNRLVGFLGERELSSITSDDGGAWLKDLREKKDKQGKRKYAPATISGTLKRAKQFFTYCVDHVWIDANPLKPFKAGSQANPSRKLFIDRDKVDLIIEACPNAEWRALVAVARYGGLRIPSEIDRLTWDDVNWKSARMLVYSPKTEHHEGQDRRYVPLFPELRPWLDELYDQAPEGVYVFPNLRGAENHRTQFARILKRSGVGVYTKPFVNLRGSCAKELTEKFGSYLAGKWLGHSPRIAAEHYLTVTEADYARAVQGTGAPAAIQPTPTGAIGDNERWGDTLSAAISERISEIVRTLSADPPTDHYARRDSNDSDIPHDIQLDERNAGTPAATNRDESALKAIAEAIGGLTQEARGVFLATLSALSKTDRPTCSSVAAKSTL